MHVSVFVNSKASPFFRPTTWQVSTAHKRIPDSHDFAGGQGSEKDVSAELLLRQQEKVGAIHAAPPHQLCRPCQVMPFQEARRLRHRPRPHLLCAARWRTACVSVRFPGGTRQVELDHVSWICKPMVELQEAQIPSREVARGHHRAAAESVSVRVHHRGGFGSWMSLAMSL